jgi:hypothetical protein
MRTFIILNIILAAVNSSTQAQLDSSFLKLLDSTIRRYQNTGTVYYADKLSDGFIDFNLKPFTKNKIISIAKTPSIDSITLTNSELIYIKKSLKSLRYFYWPDNLINNSKRIRSDSLEPFLTRLRRHAIDSIKQLKDVSEQNKYFLNSYKSFAFSKPIFLRDGSILLMFFSWYDGHGGSSMLSFFHKDENFWRKWIIVNAGDW